MSDEYSWNVKAMKAGRVRGVEETEGTWQPDRNFETENVLFCAKNKTNSWTPCFFCL